MKNSFEGIHLNEKIILKGVLNKYCVWMWTEIWLKIGS
jgi:hypothetical protein